MSKANTARSVYADRSAAERALAMALPMIESLMRDTSVVGSGFLYIVILDPAADAASRFDDIVLLEHAIGDRAQWDADYAAFARAKAQLAWRTGCSGHMLQALQPHRLREGDTLLAGAVCADGIVVGVSGAHPHYDEAFASCIAACLRAVAKQRWNEAVAQGRLFA